MHLLYFSTHLLLLVTVLLPACDRSQDQGLIVAQVGDAVLTIADLQAQQPADLNSAERASIIENWVREELLYQEALDRELDQKPSIQELIEQTRRSLLVADLLNTEFDGREVQLPEASTQQYYDQHKDEFLLIQPQMRARHILVATLRDANAKLQDLKRGDSFEQLAREHSRDPDTRFSGGDLGYFSEDDDPILWESCQNLPLNSLSKPIRSEYGYHIIQVLERQEAGTPKELDQVRPQIVEGLVNQEYQQRLEDLIAHLKTTREWIVYDRELEESP